MALRELSRTTVIALVVMGVLFLLDWWAVAGRHHGVELVAKPLAVLSVLAVGLSAGLLDQPWGRLVVMGLLFGLLGDVLLLGDSPALFQAGLAAFLIGHLAYLLAFRRMSLTMTPYAWLAVVALVTCLVVSHRLLPTVWRDGGLALAGPVTAYMLVLGAMAIAAGATGHPLIALGGLLFLMSDTILAMDRFVAPQPWAGVAVMVTYLLAQAAIVGGSALP